MRTMSIIVASAIGAALIGPSASAQDSYSTEVLSEAPPEDLAAPVRESLSDEGIRVLDAKGKPYLDLWLRKSLPTQGEITEPTGSVIFPYLQVGELVGAVRLAEDTGDYKDQVILPGVYTMRYGLQPVDGNHLGVSKFRDYVLLSLPDEDIELEPIPQDDLNAVSTGPSATNHPSVFLLSPAEADATVPSIVSEESEKRTSVVLRIPLETDQGEEKTLTTQLVIVGAGPH
ncbi:hypothetical protein [Tautonia marina]|uniref:hypothetical protein n=1 Tax=Tautonia marina TaxID=2653855 RepID=UPI001260B6F8|nr:hypothetical protein [Tautonia marina]